MLAQGVVAGRVGSVQGRRGKDAHNSVSSFGLTAMENQ